MSQVIISARAALYDCQHKGLFQLGLSLLTTEEV